MDLELATLGIRGLGERLVRLLALLVELMVGIIGPHAADLAGRTKACDVVHMTVRFVRIDTVLDPDNLFDTEILRELLLNLLLGVLRVAVLVEQTHLGGHDGALTITVERAALEDVVLGTITVNLLKLCHLQANGSILVPREVQTVNETAVSIKVEVRKGHLPIVINEERRAGVANPAVVVLHVDNAHVLNTVEDLAHRGEVFGVDAYRDGLKACNGLNDLGEDLLRRLGAAAPHVGAVRPQNPGALLLLILAGHIEPVLLRRGFTLVDGLHFKLLDLGAFA